MRLYKKDVFYLTKAMIGLCCRKLLHPHTISIDWLNFLWRCDVGNAEVQEEREEDYERRWKVQFCRFELSMNFQLCLVIYKVLIDIQYKMKPRKILGFFCFLSECYKLDFDPSGFIWNVLLLDFGNHSIIWLHSTNVDFSNQDGII